MMLFGKLIQRKFVKPQRECTLGVQHDKSADETSERFPVSSESFDVLLDTGQYNIDLFLATDRNKSGDPC